MTAALVLAELRRINDRLDALSQREPEPLIVTRDEAAKMLRVSISQLYRLVAAGRLVAQPSGIARAELERFARTPQPKLKAAMSRGKASRGAKAEADRLRAMLKAQRRPSAT